MTIRTRRDGDDASKSVQRSAWPDEGMMVRLQWLRVVREEYPSFRPSWTRSEEDVICHNPKFASLLHGVVCADDGSPVYDQPLWAERPGVVVVAVDGDGRMAVVSHFRTAPLAAGSAREGKLDLSRHGRVSFEFPRGFSNTGESPLDAALREAEEETGLAARHPELIGETNQNTTYHLFDTAIVRVLLEPGAPRHRPDPTELIARPPDAASLFKTPAEINALIRSGEIVCGLTKAAFVTQLAVTFNDFLP